MPEAWRTALDERRAELEFRLSDGGGLPQSDPLYDNDGNPALAGLAESGDANADGGVNREDAVLVLDHPFGRAPDAGGRKALDADDGRSCLRFPPGR